MFLIMRPNKFLVLHVIDTEIDYSETSITSQNFAKNMTSLSEL